MAAAALRAAGEALTTARLVALAACAVAVPLSGLVVLLDLGDAWRPYSDSCLGDPQTPGVGEPVDWLPWPTKTCWDDGGERREHPLTRTALLPLAPIVLGTALAARAPARRAGED